VSKKSFLVVLLSAGIALGGVADASAATFQIRSAPFQKGMTLVDWGTTGYPVEAVRAKLDYLKSKNVKSVTLIQTWTQATYKTTDVYAGRTSVPDDNLIAAIRYAKSIGLSVLLRPFVDPSDGIWRGHIAISSKNKNAWFASYGRFALRYAEIAQREGADIYIFASEMGYMSVHYPKDWTALANKVRAVFQGPVGYESGWGYDFQYSKWLSAVDLIGVSAYNPLCGKPTNSVSKLVSSWKTRVVKPMQAFSKKFARPVFFSEIGYRPLAKACLEPWNTEWLGPLDLTAQANLYEAAFQVWWKQSSWFRGMHLWAMGARGERATPEDHDPRDPAIARMSYWFGRSALGE